MKFKAKNFTMQQIVSKPDDYIQKFYEKTDEYIDVSPYKKYERNPIQYECRCRAGSIMTNTSTFKQHVKSKTHKDFIKNYKKYYAELDSAKDTIKELRIENEFLTRNHILNYKNKYMN